MGETVGNFSTLSWPGKVADNPKPMGLTVGNKSNTAGKEALTKEDLAEFEQKLLALVHEMAEKISKEQIDRA